MSIGYILSSLALFYNALLLLRMVFGFFVPASKWASQPLLNLLYELTEPYMHWFHGVLPPIAGIDFNGVLGVLIYQLLIGAIWAFCRRQSPL